MNFKGKVENQEGQLVYQFTIFKVKNHNLNLRRE